MDKKCNYGLIFNPNNDINNKYCISNCCIPCPMQNYFYKDNNIEYDFYIINILRNISCILSLIIIIKYIKKNKIKYNENNDIKIKMEKNINIIIIFLSLSIFLFSGVSFFSLKDPKNIQCKDIITKSTQNNNTLCSVQGSILVFSSFSVCIWILVLILNFFIYNVCNSHYIITENYFNNIIIWAIPIISTYSILVTNNISYEFSNLCLISIENIFNMFFYPLGFIIFSAFLILIISLIYIIFKCIFVTIEYKMYNNNDEYKYEIIELELAKIYNVVKFHWRYILVGLISVFTFTFYWIFYYKEINTFKNVFINLLECLNNEDINICIIKSKNELPPYRLMILSELFVSIVGIWLFIIFIDLDIFKKFNILKRIFTKNKNKTELLNII